MGGKGGHRAHAHTPSRRSTGVASTIASRASFRVATIIGPAGPAIACPRRMMTCVGQQPARTGVDMIDL